MGGGGGTNEGKNSPAAGSYDFYCSMNSGPIGGSKSHNNMPPYRVLRICIKTKEDTVDLTSYAKINDINSLNSEQSLLQ
jgi:hypothetical protein